MSPRDEPTTWRLILDKDSPGAWNMAVDEALLLSVAEGRSAPILRLYGWEPPCVSLGRAQPYQNIDLPEVKARGWGLVRRPTGGRAILHQHELTYAVVAPENHPLMRGGVLESYRKISLALVRGLEALALAVEVQGSDPLSEAARANPICFEVPSAYEITVQGCKVIGSAQVRKRKTVLQHGSLPLTGDLGQICDVLPYPDEASRDQAKSELLQRAATLEKLLGRTVNWHEAAEALIAGFQGVLDFNFNRIELSEAELSRARELLEERYQNPSWTERGIRETSDEPHASEE